ncbi:unnamed protein product [Meganyctiphanes norvegica]|uniref:C2H2-type domain-containing protein n=1 Tax=Meganyctiphanes norvegica TaxID=48144 RepID=A0AAV2SB32_MEGNR
MEVSKVFFCKNCNIRFKYDRSLQRHIRNFHQEESFYEITSDNIQYVQKSISNDSNSVNTLDTHKSFDCKYCNSRFKYKINLRKHIMIYHKEDIVDENLQYELKLISNNGEVSGTMAYVCNICTKEFPREVYMKKHIRNFHNSTIDHECDICNKVFTSKHNLKRHRKKLHSDLDNKNIQCTILINTSKTKEPETCIIPIKEDNNIRIFTKDNNKERIVCQVCDKQFDKNKKYMLNKHMEKVHFIQPRKPIKCCVNGCSKSFNFLQHLRMHVMDPKDAGGHNCRIEKEENIFNNLKDFHQWKEDIEDKEGIKYIAHKGQKNNKDGSCTRIYFCSRSGTYCYNGTGKRSSKNQGTSKIGTYCPSTMNIYCSAEGIVKCKYYKTHLAHETSGTNIRHIQIPKRDKLFIAEKSLQGIDTKKILEELHKKCGRSAYIEHQDVLNVLRSNFVKDVERCKSSRNLEVNKIDINKYKVSSKDGAFHEVMFLQYCTCLNKCLLCGVCYHSCICDCEDYNKMPIQQMNMCKHIHAIGAVNIEKSEKRHINEACFEKEEQLLNENCVVDKKGDQLLNEICVADKKGDPLLNENCVTDKNEVHILNKNCVPERSEREKKIEEANAILSRIKSSLNKHSIEGINEIIHHIKKIET